MRASLKAERRAPDLSVEVMAVRSSRSAVRARGLARDERGFVVPTSLFLVLAALGVVMVGVLASISAQSGTVRDLRTKSALQAAESGVDQALLRYNTYADQGTPLTAAFPCITAAGGRAAPSSGWCAGVTSNVGGGTATYYVHPVYSGALPASAEIVSVGNVSGVTRRVDVTATTAAGQQVFANATVIGLNGIQSAGNAEIHAVAATNGDYVLANNAKQCGQASVGLGHALVLNNNAGYYSGYTYPNCTGPLSASSVSHAPMSLAPASQGNAASSNDNARITNALNGGTPADLIQGNGNGNSNHDVNWNPATRVMSIDHKASLTLTGTKYSFCKVTLLQNSALYITAGQSVSIFFDSPEACGQTSGTTQLAVDQNTRISSADGSPTSAALIFVGSPVLATTAILSSNTSANGQCVQNFVVYAPYTDIHFDAFAKYCGAMGGKSIVLDSNAVIDSDSASQAYTLPPTSAHYGISKYIECPAAPASPPNSGC